MPESSPTPSKWREAGFDELCHDLKNPLMVIRGRAQLVERAIMRSTELPEAERTHILQSLAVIDAAVLDIVGMIDESEPLFLKDNAGRKSARIRRHASRDTMDRRG